MNSAVNTQVPVNAVLVQERTDASHQCSHPEEGSSPVAYFDIMQPAVHPVHKEFH